MSLGSGEVVTPQAGLAETGVATGGRAGAGAHPVARTALRAVGRHDAGAAVAAAVLTNIGRSAVAENDPAPVLG